MARISEQREGTLTRLLRVEDIPLSDPELVHRTAAFEGPPTVFTDTCRVVSSLRDHAESLSDDALVKRLDAITIRLSSAAAILHLLRHNTATDQPAMFIASEILVCFVTFEETDSDYLMNEVEGMLTAGIYDFQPVPEIAALLPATYGAKYFS